MECPHWFSDPAFCAVCKGVVGKYTDSFEAQAEMRCAGKCGYKIKVGEKIVGNKSSGFYHDDCAPLPESSD